MARRCNADENKESVTIGELVKLTDTRYSTLKYYTEVGLLQYEQVEERLTRRYNRENAVKTLETIKNLKAQGLTIIEIKDKLSITF
ncbi:MAG: MerR family transcriptional regulator [Anaerocolumna sp.]|nr:MerR family transcriptional regulator [Anaerocolumna sp.]